LRLTSLLTHLLVGLFVLLLAKFLHVMNGFLCNLRKIFRGCQRMAQVSNAVEILPKI